MKVNKVHLKKNVLYVGLILLHLLLMGLLCSQKADFHMDEILTFGLANNVEGMFPTVEHGMEYKGWGPYYGGIVVNEGEAFDYKSVWKNQANDVHPVLHYIFIHTVCSVFKNQFSMWFGIIVNLFCLIFIDILLFQISNIIFESKLVAMGATAFFGTSYLLINMMSFIRMYSMLMVFILLISLIFLLYFDKKKDFKFYCYTCLTVLGGLLTQYFFVIYLFFLCLFMGIKILFIDKNVRETILFCTSILSGMILAVIVFPSMIKHILVGDRGKESVQNFVTIGDMLDRVKEYGRIINSEVCGGILFVVLLLALVWIIVAIKRRYHLFNAKLMLIMSASVYFLIVAKISPIVHDRYIAAVCPIFSVFSVYLVFVVFDLKNHINKEIVFCVLLMVINIFTMAKSNWATAEMYKNSVAMQIAQSNADKVALCIGDTRWRNLYSANQLRNYKGYFFADSADYGDMIDEINDELVIYVEGDLNYDTIEKELVNHGSVTYLGRNIDTDIMLYTPSR